MCILIWKYRTVIKPFILLALCFISLKSFPQLRAVGDTVILIPSGSFIQIKDSISYFSTDTVLLVPAGIDPYVINERNKGFYDSLKIKAGRKLLTKKLYDFVVIEPDRTPKKEIDKESDENYLIHTEKKIRRIEIKRLDVFGTNINNPGAQSSGKSANILRQEIRFHHLY